MSHAVKTNAQRSIEPQQQQRFDWTKIIVTAITTVGVIVVAYLKS